MTANKANLSKLLSARSEKHTAEVPGFGEVEVRPLTRKECMNLAGKEIDAAEVERIVLSLALVEPQMSQEEVGQWQDVASFGELQPVLELVLKISGLEQMATKAAMQNFRPGS